VTVLVWTKHTLKLTIEVVFFLFGIERGAMFRFVAALLRCRLKNLPAGFPIRNFHHAIPANKSFGGIFVANALAI